MRTAESPLGQAAATVIAWLLLVIAVVPTVLTGMVPGNRGTDFIVPTCLDFFFVAIATWLHWVGAAPDRSAENQSLRLMVFRVIAAGVLMYPLIAIATGS